MRTHVWKFFVVGLLGIILGISGCSGGDSQSPTSAALPENSEELSNFWAGEGNYKNVSAYVDDTYFRIFVPAGDYLLTYKIQGGGTYYVAFRAAKSAAVSFGIRPEHTLSEIWLQEGEINTYYGYVKPSGPVTLYSWPGPGFTSPPWDYVFTPDADSEAMLLYIR